MCSGQETIIDLFRANKRRLGSGMSPLDDKKQFNFAFDEYLLSVGELVQRHIGLQLALKGESRAFPDNEEESCFVRISLKVFQDELQILLPLSFAKLFSSAVQSSFPSRGMSLPQLGVETAIAFFAVKLLAEEELFAQQRVCLAGVSLESGELPRQLTTESRCVLIDLENAKSHLYLFWPPSLIRRFGVYAGEKSRELRRRRLLRRVSQRMRLSLLLQADSRSDGLGSGRLLSDEQILEAHLAVESGWALRGMRCAFCLEICRGASSNLLRFKVKDILEGGQSMNSAGASEDNEREGAGSSFSIPLSIELGVVELTFDQLLNLSSGQVFEYEFEQSRPLRLLSGEEEVGLVQLLVEDGKVAVQILEVNDGENSRKQFGD